MDCEKLFVQINSVGLIIQICHIYILTPTQLDFLKEYIYILFLIHIYFLCCVISELKSSKFSKYWTVRFKNAYRAVLQNINSEDNKIKSALASTHTRLAHLQQEYEHESSGSVCSVQWGDSVQIDFFHEGGV